MKNLIAVLIVTFTIFSSVNATNLEFELFSNLEKFNITDVNKSEASLNDYEVKTIFFWEVETRDGKARGTSPTLEDAKKIINLMIDHDVYSLVLIESGEVRVKK